VLRIVVALGALIVVAGCRAPVRWARSADPRRSRHTVRPPGAGAVAVWAIRRRAWGYTNGKG